VVTSEQVLHATAYEFVEILGTLEYLGITAQASLEREVRDRRKLDDVRPGDGITRDITLMDPGPHPVSAIAAQFDLTTEAGRKALAIAAAVPDVEGERKNLVIQGMELATDNDWLQSIGQWAAGDFSDSILSRDEAVAQRWLEPMGKVLECGGGFAEWASIIWGAPDMLWSRYLPLALEHGDASTLLEMSHRAIGQFDRAVCMGLSGIRPLRDLSAVETRACIGRACVAGLGHALAELDDPTVSSVRASLECRAAALECVHDRTRPSER
jgi:hypothetical protein